MNRNKSITTLLLVICPMLSLPCILVEIYNRRRYAFYYLAIFLSLVGFLTAPTGDLARYQLDYYKFANLSFVDLFNQYTYQILFYGFSFTFAKAGFNFEFVRLLFSFISFSCLFDIFWKITNNHSASDTRKKYFLLFLVYLFALPLNALWLGYRHYFAMSLMLYSYYLVLVEGNKKGWLFAVTSVFIHFSMCFPFLCFVLINFSHLKFRKSIVYVLCLIFIYINSDNIVISIFDWVPLSAEMKLHYNYYLVGYWASDFLSDFSWKYELSLLLSYLTLFPLLFFMLSVNEKDKLLKMYYISLIILSLVISFKVIFFRYVFIPIFLSLFFFFIYRNKYLTKSKIYILLFFSFITFLSGIYTYRNEYSISRHTMLVYKPLPLILCNSFSKQWLHNNVYEDGNFKHN